MNKKILLILFLFLYSCGYSPMYSNLNKSNINIDIIETSGEIKINNKIVRKLTKYKTTDADKNYDVKIESSYNKTSLTKDVAGNTTDYRLNLEVNFTMNFEGNSKKIILKEKFDIKKGDTNFQEETYENILIDDMINLIIQEFISQL